VLLLRRGRADDHVALVERNAQCRDLVLLQLVLVGQRLDLLLLDEAALGGLLEQALGRREVVQMNRVGNLNPFRRGRGRWARPPGKAVRTVDRESPFPSTSYRTA
jgi:hypothetical protein